MLKQFFTGTPKTVVVFGERKHKPKDESFVTTKLKSKGKGADDLLPIASSFFYTQNKVKQPNLNYLQTKAVF